jgi:CheY-like chemotaxis protein
VKVVGLTYSETYSNLYRNKRYRDVGDRLVAGAQEVVMWAPRKGTTEDRRPAPRFLDMTRRPVLETVLLAEDEDTVREVARRILAQKGYQVFVAPGAEEALEFAENHPGAIDILVTDLVLPRMSGSELAERLKAARPRLKVVYMSGYPADRQGVLDGPLLEKPFNARALLGLVREAAAQPDPPRSGDGG